MLRLKRQLAGFAAAITLASAPLGAQTAPAPAPQAAAPAAGAPAARDVDPALWVVRDEDTTIYLFGTVHVLKPGLSWFDEAVRDAFDGSDTLVIEMVEPAPAEMQQLIRTTAIDTSGRTLGSRLDEAQRAKLTQALASVGAPPTALDPLEPWFAATVLSLMPLPALGYDPAQGVEQQLKAAAAQAGKPVIPLETAAEQIAIFDGLGEATQMRMLASVIEDFDEVGTTIDTMVDQWGRGDPAALAATLNEQLAHAPEAYEALLTNRNARWAEWIAERMATPGTVFLAVGAGHLAGAGSVQEQLGRHELTVERIDY